jgi:hypothetical protein
MDGGQRSSPPPPRGPPPSVPAGPPRITGRQSDRNGTGRRAIPPHAGRRHESEHPHRKLQASAAVLAPCFAEPTAQEDAVHKKAMTCHGAGHPRGAGAGRTDRSTQEEKRSHAHRAERLWVLSLETTKKGSDSHNESDGDPKHKGRRDGHLRRSACVQILKSQSKIF